MCDNNYYVVTERGNGTSLKEFVDKKGFLMENESKNYFKQIQEGIRYCHDRCIAHNNLSLKNVYLKYGSDRESEIDDNLVVNLYILMTI